MTKNGNRLGILVGGGPAPGINSVIGAATIRALLEGVEVVGIQDGFQWLMRGDTEHTRLLDMDEVSRIHFRGGSILGIARANPTTDPAYLDAVTKGLQSLGIDKLVTIGGDDTAFSAMKVAERSAGTLQVVHVPKTIDNDLDLPPAIDTFGYQTARHVGSEMVKNLMVDAYTTSRWYFVVSMGRKAGHLALGIGKAAGATVTLIPEEVGRPTNIPQDHRRYAGLRDPQATERGPAARRGGDRRRRHREDRSDRPLGAEGRRARRPRPRAHRGDRYRRHPEARRPDRAPEPGPQGDPGRQEYRLRAALRRSHPVRHGVHPRSRLLRGAAICSAAAVA